MFRLWTIFCLCLLMMPVSAFAQDDATEEPEPLLPQDMYLVYDGTENWLVDGSVYERNWCTFHDDIQMVEIRDDSIGVVRFDSSVSCDQDEIFNILVDIYTGEVVGYESVPTVYVTAESVRVRSEPTTSGNNVIRSAKYGELFVLREDEDPVSAAGYTWLPIIIDNEEGWIAQEGFAEVIEESEIGDQAKVRSETYFAGAGNCSASYEIDDTFTLDDGTVVHATGTVESVNDCATGIRLSVSSTIYFYDLTNGADTGLATAQTGELTEHNLPNLES